MSGNSSDGCKDCGDSNGCFDHVEIPVGPRGLQGVPGRDGKDGVNGKDGEQGVQGIQGEQGEQGTQGVQGVAGDTGDTGATGGTGSAGATGAIGPKGDDGGDGSKILFGSGAPSNGLGNDDDVYNDTTTSYPQIDIYQKVTETWQLQGRFGNVVNPGTPTPDAQSFLFKAGKVSNQFLDGATNEMVLFFEDDKTSPVYFDNGEVWSSYDFTSDQDVTGVQFTLEGLDMSNSTGADIDVTVDIRHRRPPASEVVKATVVVTVPLGSNIVTALLKTIGIDLVAGDKVRVVATPATGVAGDVTVTAGDFYNNRTV